MTGDDGKVTDGDGKMTGGDGKVTGGDGKVFTRTPRCSETAAICNTRAPRKTVER